MNRRFAFNPVTLGELRQLVRSRAIAVALLLHPLALFAADTLALANIANQRSAEELAAGAGLGEGPFALAAILTGIVVVAVIPAFAAVKTCLEVRQDRLGLEFATALTPADVVSGKMLAATLLMLIVIALAMPFFTLAYFMRGVALSQIFAMPFRLLAGGVASLSLLTFIASHRWMNAALRIVLSLAALTTATIAAGVVFAVRAYSREAEFADGAEPGSSAAVCAGTALATISLALVVRGAAAALLAPDHLDAARSLRKTEAVLFPLWLGFAAHPGVDAVWIAGVYAMSVIVCLRAAFHPRPIPRAARLAAPANPVARIFAFPLATGRIPGLVFGLAMFAAASAVAFCTGKIGGNDAAAFFALGAEPVAAAILVSSIASAKKASPRGFRITAAVLAALALIVVSAPVLAVFDIGNRDAFNGLPCSISGIDADPVYHAMLAAVMLTVAVAMLIKPYWTEMRNYKPPE